MYYTSANDPIAEEHMERLLENYRNDGATIEHVTSPNPGIVVQLPGEPERFYSKR